MTDILEIDETLPEVVKSFLRKGYKLEQIILHEEGHWTHRNQKFDNKRIINLFNRSVSRTPGGTWVIDVGQFVYPITVEDCGYFVQRIDRQLDTILLHLSDGTQENIDFDTISYEPEGKLFCRIKEGAFKARFMRTPYHGLEDCFAVQDEYIVLNYDKHTIKLTPVESSLV